MTRKIALPAVAALLLASCAAVPHDPPRVAQVQDGALGLDSRTAPIATDWWSAFGDPQLDTLIAAGLAGNPSLTIALTRVRAAEAQIEDEHSGLLPQIKGTAEVQRAHIADNLPPPIGGNTGNLGIVAASLNWDLDLFGRQRSLVRQASNTAEAARLDVAVSRLAVSVSIAQTYVGLTRAERLIKVADGFVQTRQKALGYAQSRVKNQLGNKFELRQAETLLAEAEQARTQAEQQRDILVHALAALVGRGADFYPQVTAPTLALDKPPVVPDLLPSDLLGRRPDLVAGQVRIEAAVQGRKAAAAAFLPDVNISLLGGLTAIGLGNFFSTDSGTVAGGPALSVPIFEGGRLKARYKGATADLDEAVASYNNSVLGAVHEAADAITNVHAADKSLAEQGRVVSGLRDTVQLDQVRVSTGLGSQLDAIDSGFRLLEAEQALVGFQADALARRIQLVAALGGGFDPNRSHLAATASDTHS